MCDLYIPCNCLRSAKQKKRPLTFLLLDCWQREYDKRPYRNFVFRRLLFEEKMKRVFDFNKDFPVLVRFFLNRKFVSISIFGVHVLPNNVELLIGFADGLSRLLRIELKLMTLPNRLFELLRDRASRMQVRELSFEGSFLNKTNVIELRAFLIHTKTLRYINVANCQIDQYNFALLADGIHKCNSLRGFNCSRLMGNHLTLDTQKISHIVSSLIWDNKLNEIEMRQCEFLAHDMETISEYLTKKDSVLKKLILAGNIMASDGAEFLFRAIVQSHMLAYLDISRNGLGSHGGDVVSKYLSSCYRLEYLDISYNDIGSNAINNILTCMKKPVKLMHLKLYGNIFDGRSAIILRRLLDARVVPKEAIDITSTYDETTMDYRVIPYF